VSSLRSGIAALALLVFLRGRLALSPAVLGVATVYGATLTLFVLATKLTTAANAIFLQSTYPLGVLLMAPWLLGEQIGRRDLLYLAAVAVGLILCVAGRPIAMTTAPNPLTGNVFAVLSGVAWALTLLGLRYLEQDLSRQGTAMAAVVTGNLFACVIGLPLVWPLPRATVGEWATIVYLGVFQIGLAYVFLTRAVGRLPAVEMSLLLLLEPVLNPVWAWLVRGEQPGAWTMMGGAVIIAATAVKIVAEGGWMSSRAAA
jgi:drug/metabolite transporter, DME family